MHILNGFQIDLKLVKRFSRCSMNFRNQLITLPCFVNAHAYKTRPNSLGFVSEVAPVC